MILILGVVRFKMKIKNNDQKMTIDAQYKSRGEFRKLAQQKKVRLTIKALEKGGMLKAVFNKEKLCINIKCYNLKIYNQILKGFKSVASLT